MTHGLAHTLTTASFTKTEAGALARIKRAREAGAIADATLTYVIVREGRYYPVCAFGEGEAFCVDVANYGIIITR